MKQFMEGRQEAEREGAREEEGDSPSGPQPSNRLL